MSQKHLTVGSQNPPKADGKLRLYSMEYCPYAHRARLVLIAKGIPHEIVNINLINKPEWYFSIHPEGKVPALDTGSEIIVESLVIADYLDEKYSNPALYPLDPEIKKQDKELIQKIGPLTDLYSKTLFGVDKRTAQEWHDAFLPVLTPFEKVLVERGTTYFGGDNPGMVDYMLWPWGERAAAVALAVGEKLPFTDNEVPLLRKWRKAMRADKVVEQIYTGPEKFWKIVQFKLKSLPPDYDGLE